MKTIKKILCILVIMVISVQTSFAEVTFSETNMFKKDEGPRRIIDTGQGYFLDTRDGQILYSKNKIDWEDVSDKIPVDLDFYVAAMPAVDVIETEDKFIICNIPFMKGEVRSYDGDRVGRLVVTDKEFNIIKDIETDRISDISYINGVCYINKYLEYLGEPGQDVRNIVTKQTSYYSSDFEDWSVYKEDGGIPVLNNGKEIFVKTDLIYIPDKTRIYLPFNEHTNLKTMISQKGETKQTITYESISPRSLIKINNYFIGIPKDGSSTMIIPQENGKLFVSKDGVYFTEIMLPEKARIYGVFELNNGNLEYCMTNNHSYEFSVENLEDTVRVGDIYVQFQDEILGFEIPPVIEEGRTLVPMRFLFEQMGANVEWNGETQTATAMLNNTAVTFAIDDTEAEVNNTPATMEVPARLINGKTMVPLRFLSEEMGFEVTWDAESRTAIIE